MMSKYTDIEKEKFKASTIIKLCGEIKEGMLKKLTQYSFILYEVGRYEISLKVINCVYSLLQQNHYDEQSILNILWGKIGCELVLQKFDEAKETIKAIRKELENESFQTESSHF